MTYNFYMFICHLYVFFAQVSIKIFCQFSIGLFVYCCILKVIWIFRRIFLYHMCLLQISFSQFVAYPFILLTVSLTEQTYFIILYIYIMRLGLSILFSWIMPLVLYFKSCCYSVAKLCLTLCDPMDWSTTDSSIFLIVLHYLLEFAQIHVHWVSEAI